MKAMPCRLSVILAREAPRAVIFRRGPSDLSQMIAWETDTDTFQAGQWLHGKVFTERCDLSPDGSKLIYFVSKYELGRHADPSYGYCWTAISKPPYFTALALWPAWNTYGGGGYFEDNTTVRLNQTYQCPPHENHVPPQTVIVKPILDDNNFYYEDALSDLRMKRNGWTLIQERGSLDGTWDSKVRHYNPTGIWQKVNGNYTLIREIVGLRRSIYSRISKFTVKRQNSYDELVVDSEIWADWDRRGRLVYVNQGRVFVGHIQGEKIVPQLLADFNENRRRPVIAPEWARQW